MDVIDRANATAERLTAAALSQRAACVTAARPRQGLFDAITGARVCLDCEEAIPAARIAAHPHAVRCIDCQADHERRHR